MSLRRLLFVGLVVCAGECIDGIPVWAQTIPAQAAVPAPPSSQDAAPRLRVFLDCDCFEDYLRDQITWVDYVRQAQDADVHLLSTDRETGGGGRELVLRFVGRGRFADVSQDLRVVSQVAEPESLRREQVLTNGDRRLAELHGA